ncbi:unnamed protein product [Rangifer tarandus platyrhynchus]|uniref:Uncharacterized protein n=2 Tax=Rangifer tarandus platyrhynchus TaxID=3082113 RepID=A0ACB0F6S3_RANTA|nr:unnamed protein product [Rangifer tarandus platyrhynchus]CAI9707791.1 unnamed protein product [Rangifer tarandus platyrhynchus]
MRPRPSSNALTRASSRPPPPFDQSLPECERGPERTRSVPERDLEGTQAGRSFWPPGSGRLRRGRGASAGGEERRSPQPRGEVGCEAAGRELHIPRVVCPSGGRGGLGRGGAKPEGL